MFVCLRINKPRRVSCQVAVGGKDGPGTAC